MTMTESGIVPAFLELIITENVLWGRAIERWFGVP